MNKIYGFDGEVKSKFGEKMVEVFSDLFCCLPLAHVINNRIFVVHGGLFSKDGVMLDDIRAINRFQEPPDEGKYTLHIPVGICLNYRSLDIIITSTSAKSHTLSQSDSCLM